MSSVNQPSITGKQEQDDWRQLPSVGSLLRMTFEKWYTDNIPRHAAALAFYTLFAIAPLLLLSVEAMSLLYGRQTAEEQLARQIEQYVHSAEAAAFTQTILDNALPSSGSWYVTVGIVVALIYGASSVFWELQVMLNIIWGVHPAAGNFRQVIWQRILAIIMVILSGLLIVVGLVATLWYAELTSWTSRFVSSNSNFDQLAYFLITLGLTALVFALIYKFVPDVAIAWPDVITGALATAFLVSVARLVITLYMSYNRIGSIYGAAGSLVILLLWVYYSSQIFFLGAEFTHVYSRTYGAHRNGTDSAAPPAAAAKRAAPADATKPPLVVKAEERDRAPVQIEVVNLDPHTESAIPVEDTPDEEEVRGNGRRFGLPSLPRPSLSLPKPQLPAVRERWQSLRQGLSAIVAWPLRIYRPIRELVVAVGVIGALSLAALFGFPWVRRNPDTATQEQPPPDDAPTTNDQ
jgi:membrane protein